MSEKSEEYVSKTKLGECSNDCKNKRRHGSKFCQQCSDKYKNK